MAKTAFPQFDLVAANNTDLNSINVNTGWPAVNIGTSTRNFMSLAKKETAAQDTVVAAGATDVTEYGSYLVSGNTAITSFVVTSGARRKLTFSGAPTLTYHATNLVTPTAANIVVVAGDTCEIEATATNHVKVLWYQRADGTPLVTGTLTDASVTAQKLAVKGNFQPYAQSTPDMTIALAEGTLQAGTALTRIASQNTSTITAPVTNPRKDIVYIDAVSGVIGVATGAEAGSPVDPAVPAGKIAVARITLATSTTSITNSLIADLRGGESGSLVESSGLTITTSSTDTFAHGLGSTPSDFGGYLVAGGTPQLGFTAGQRVNVMTLGISGGAGQGLAVYADATNIYATWGSAAVALVSLSTFTLTALDYTKWTLVLWARS
jgi:hypothetical protein